MQRVSGSCSQGSASEYVTNVRRASVTYRTYPYKCAHVCRQAHQAEHINSLFYGKLLLWLPCLAYQATSHTKDKQQHTFAALPFNIHASKNIGAKGHLMNSTKLFVAKHVSCAGQQRQHDHASV